MKVGLFLCPHWHAAFPTYALAGLSAQLKARGHQTGIFDVNQSIRLLNQCKTDGRGLPDLTHDWLQDGFVDRQFEIYASYLDALVDRVLSEDYRVLGFQLYFTNVQATLRLAGLFKRRDPSVIVVLGGSECLDFDRCRTYARQESVDAVIYGEGDLAFPRLVDAAERTGRPQPAAGVLLRGDEARWKDEQDRVLELDLLPYADYSGHNLPLYAGGKTVHSCRGCVRRCVFCSEWRDKDYRQMSAERIYGELAHHLRQDPGIDTFLFADSLLNGSMGALDRLCDLILSGGRKLRWHGYAIVRPDMTPEALGKMAAAGCDELFFGLESGSARLLKEIGKNVPPALNGRVLAQAAAAGLKTAAGWLVGFPTETEEDFQESLRFIAAHGKSLRRLEPNPFMIAELMGEWDRYNLVPTDHPMFWRTRDGSNTFPIRVDRLRRLFQTAAEHGVEVYWEGLRPAQFEQRFDAMLEKYRRWEESQASMASPSSSGTRARLSQNAKPRAAAALASRPRRR